MSNSRIERPDPTPSDGFWVSDIAAELLRAIDIPFVALNPGASFRGLHDSLVNHVGNVDPKMLLCLHEEHAVAIAHGWSKVTGQPMAAIVHSNVGLMHATMAVFNAWCDRAPVILMGATGPVDAAKRRPWIDWIHTAKDQGALIRPYSKWDDQPSSPGALVESVFRANQIARTAPCGPVYVCLDAGLQEARIDEMPRLPDPARFAAPKPPKADADLIDEVAKRLQAARRPVILMGRVGRSQEDWDRRVQLAEVTGALVITDLKTAGAFPTGHSSLGAHASTLPNPTALGVLREADVILSLDWIDLAGTLKAAFGSEPAPATIISASLDHHLHNGWSMDHQGLAAVDINLAAGPDGVVTDLLETMPSRDRVSDWDRAGPEPIEDEADSGGQITVPELAQALRAGLNGRETTLVRGTFSWSGHLWGISGPLDYLGIDGGAGLGSGPGIAVGAALALRESGRVTLSVFGDGDFMMGCQAIWTACHYRIPLIVFVANNQSFYNDELHQERMARQRGRLVENKWIGQRVADPDIDIAMVARAQGATGIGPVRTAEELEQAVAQAIEAFDRGEVVVVDVRVLPGYDANTTRLTAKGESDQPKPSQDRGGAG